MAAVVDAVTSVGQLAGAAPIVVGGLAVLTRLSSAHRATLDLDIVDRRSDGRPRQLEILRGSPETTAAEPAAVMVPTRFGEVRVDVLEVNQSELDHPSDDAGDRLHAGSHAWAADTATPVTISVLGSAREELARASTRIAEPGPLVAMKLQAIMDRGGAKAGTDLWDIIRLTLDPVAGRAALRQLETLEARFAADVVQHVDQWFRKKRDWSLDRLGEVTSASVSGDDLDLVAELLVGACLRAS
ncbi:prevent-host-death protein [Kribbella hippodromi]